MKTSWLLLLCCASVFVTSLLAEKTLQEEQERGLSDSLKDAWTGYQIASLFGKRDQERGLLDKIKDAYTGYKVGGAIASFFGKRDQNEVEKRGWKSALGRVMGRDTEDQVEKRGWKSMAAGAAAGALLGRKRDSQDQVEKRGWKSVAAGAAAGALLGKKRDSQDQVEKRGWKSMAAGAAAGYFLGKKRDSQVEATRMIYPPFHGPYYLRDSSAAEDTHHQTDGGSDSTPSDEEIDEAVAEKILQTIEDNMNTAAVTSP